MSATGGQNQPTYALKPGEIISGYEIEREIGAGGFGIVYSGFNPGLGKRAAIKEFFPSGIAYRSGSTVILRNEADRRLFDKVLARFEETTRILHGLDHPNIVMVHGFERRNQTAYMIMDYVDGVTALKWRDSLGRPPTLEEIRAIFQPVMSALVYMHQRNLIHRDVSPMNIMIRRDDRRPILIDFGTMKQFLAEEADKRAAISSIAICNRAYAPPEQLTGDSSKHGFFTDVYALAASLYHMLAGEPPEPSERRKDAAVLYKGPDPYRSIAVASRLALPSGLAAAIDRALTLAPAERTPDVGVFMAELGWSAERPTRLIGDLPPREAPVAAQTLPALAISAVAAAAPTGRANTPYAASVAEISGGRPPYSVAAYGLPAGLSALLDGSVVRLAGNPAAPGGYAYSLEARDASGARVWLQHALSVDKARTGAPWALIGGALALAAVGAALLTSSPWITAPSETPAALAPPPAAAPPAAAPPAPPPASAAVRPEDAAPPAGPPGAAGRSASRRGRARGAPGPA